MARHGARGTNPALLHAAKTSYFTDPPLSTLTHASTPAQSKSSGLVRSAGTKPMSSSISTSLHFQKPAALLMTPITTPSVPPLDSSRQLATDSTISCMVCTCHTGSDTTRLREHCEMLINSLGQSSAAAKHDRLQILKLTDQLAAAQELIASLRASTASAGNGPGHAPYGKGPSLRSLRQGPSSPRAGDGSVATTGTGINIRVDGLGFTAPPPTHADLKALQDRLDAALLAEKLAKEALVKEQQGSQTMQKEHRRVVTELQKQIETLKTELKQAGNTVEGLKEKLIHSQQALSCEQGIVADLQASLRALSATKSNLEVENISLKGETASLRDELSKLQSYVSQLEEEQKLAQNTAVPEMPPAPCQKCTMLEKDLLTLTAAEQALARKLATTEATLEMERKTMEALKVELAAAQAEAKRQREARHAIMAETVHGLRQQVASLTSALVTQSSSQQLVGESDGKESDAVLSPSPITTVGTVTAAPKRDGVLAPISDNKKQASSSRELISEDELLAEVRRSLPSNTTGQSTPTLRSSASDKTMTLASDPNWKPTPVIRNHMFG